MVPTHAAAVSRLAVETSVAQRHSLPSGGSDEELRGDGPAPVGLAAERGHLERLGLSQNVVRTIQGARVTYQSITFCQMGSF